MVLLDRNTVSLVFYWDRAASDNNHCEYKMSEQNIETNRCRNWPQVVHLDNVESAVVEAAVV